MIYLSVKQDTILHAGGTTLHLKTGGNQEIMKTSSNKNEEAHRGAFHKVCSVIDEKIVKDQKVVRLSHLRNVYISHLSEMPFPHPRYRGDKLKSKIQNHEEFQGVIEYCPIGRDSSSQSYMVYNL